MRLQHGPVDRDGVDVVRVSVGKDSLDAGLGSGLQLVKRGNLCINPSDSSPAILSQSLPFPLFLFIIPPFFFHLVVRGER